jgi:hypothetical protein
MTLESSGSVPDLVQEKIANLHYWMWQREQIRHAKEAGQPKPWSADPIFQQTYFTNVHREDDRVTKFIRTLYSSEVNDPMFEVNIGFARIINEPTTLNIIGYISNDSDLRSVGGRLRERQEGGFKVFGDAYIVSTNGRTMPKAAYIADVLLPALMGAVGPQGTSPRATIAPRCSAWYERYMRIFGISSFMAGQNIADLKNTPGHPLYTASDRSQFSCPGPGSLRGLSWIFHGDDTLPVAKTYEGDIAKVHALLALRDPVIEVDRQDLQNCLCEFDKYMRILHGTGRSKRRYNGV